MIRQCSYTLFRTMGEADAAAWAAQKADPDHVYHITPLNTEYDWFMVTARDAYGKVAGYLEVAS